MKKLYLGILLIIMMFGHNFVLNQTQSMQSQLTKIFKISVTQFNLLYSIPSGIAILFIIPMGFFSDKYTNLLLWGGAFALSIGQLFITIFGAENKGGYFDMLMTGRVFQLVGSQILYMIQGNMASSWMGRYAGIVFILPQIGQILNVFATPAASLRWGVQPAFFIGLITCIMSTLACIGIYYLIKKNKKLSNDYEKKQAQQSSGTNLPQQFSQNNSKPSSIFHAGKVFWLVIVLCGINQCLYFPFLDNITQLITNRFCIKYENTGYFLCIPFISAMITSTVSSYILTLMPREKIIFIISFMPLIGHSIIYFDQDCSIQTGPTFINQLILIVGFIFYGIGIGTYYSVSFPAVGLSVPQEIRGMAYACMAFFQAIALTLIPIMAGIIIEREESIKRLSLGYKQQSILFILISLVGVLVSYFIFHNADGNSFIYNDQQQIKEQQTLSEQQQKQLPMYSVSS